MSSNRHIFEVVPPSKKDRVKTTYELAKETANVIFWKKVAIGYWVVVALIINALIVFYPFYQESPWTVGSIFMMFLLNALFVVKVITHVYGIKNFKKRHKNLSDVASRLQEIKNELNR